MHHIEVSYDMGWQVRSSGGKYGSHTGQGLLIGVRTKMVLDSTVFNKKWIVHRALLTNRFL